MSPPLSINLIDDDGSHYSGVDLKAVKHLHYWLYNIVVLAAFHF